MTASFASNWASGGQQIVMRKGKCGFERCTARLGLAEHEWPDSPVLRAWVERNLDHRYVPEWLLHRWGLAPNVMFT